MTPSAAPAAMSSTSALQAIAFRLTSHHLAAPLPLSALGEAAAIGLRERPPESAALALRARVKELSPDAYERATAAAELVATYAMRGAVYVAPRDQAAVFVAGSLPSDDKELRSALGNWASYLDSQGVAGSDALNTVTGAIREILGSRGGPLTKGDISSELHTVLLPALEPMCPGCGVGHVPEQLFRLAVIAAGTKVVPGLRPTTFLPADAPPSDRDSRREAGQKLARLFVHLYGPTTADHFAAWRGFLSEAGDGFSGIGEELVPTKFHNRTAWALETDRAVLADPPIAAGVTLLPRDDPFVAQRDRATLAPDKELRRRLWTATGSTGAVLVQGELAALWRGRKQGRRFTVSVEPVQMIRPRALRALATEANAFAAFKGAEEGVVQVAHT